VVEQAPVVSRVGTWLRDPAHPGYLRWWDGQGWTEHYQPLPWAGAPPPEASTDPALRWLLPVGRSGYAIAAGYLGLFSVILVFAPFAVIMGCLALWDIDNHPGRLGRGRAVFGIVMGGLFSLLLFATLLAQ
jgi:hypothetical protein